MLDKQKTKPSFIGLAGNIGVGKTTFTKNLAKKYGWKPINNLDYGFDLTLRDFLKNR